MIINQYIGVDGLLDYLQDNAVLVTEYFQNGNSLGVHAIGENAQELIDSYNPDLYLTKKKQALIKKLDEIQAVKLNEMTGGATQQEVDTYLIKRAASLAVLNNTATEYDLSVLQPEATANGIELSQLARIIVEKANAYYAGIGQLAAWRAENKHRINAVETFDQLNVLTSEYIT